MAPEIFENKPYSLKADVYSFGVQIQIIKFILKYDFRLYYGKYVQEKLPIKI